MAADNVERELTCASCGANNEPGSTYCAYCGTLLPEKKIEKESVSSTVFTPVSISGEKIAFKRVSVGIAVLFTILTFGIYPVVWVLLRKKAFNELKGTEKIAGWLASLPLILWGLSIAIQNPEIQGIMRIASWITWIILAFKMRKMLREYIASFGDEDVLPNIAPSKIMTFFFTFFYIQYHINRLIDIGVFKRAN